MECTFGSPCIRVNCPFWRGEIATSDPFKCISPGELTSLTIPDADRNILKNSYTPSEFQEYFMNFHFSGTVSQRSSINGHQFVLPSLPPFYFSNFSDCIDQVCTQPPKSAKEEHCTYYIEIPENKVIQLVLFNMGMSGGLDGTSHPVHLHGHHFYVVAVGYPLYNSTTRLFRKSNTDINCPDDSYCNDATWSDQGWNNGNVAQATIANLNNPPKKDTVLIPVGGYVVLRFRSDNSGYWFMHCHIEIHQAEGMAVIIKEGSDQKLRGLVGRSESQINKCSKGPEPFTIYELNAANSLKSPISCICILLSLILV
jgi:hypothetical protein